MQLSEPVSNYLLQFQSLFASKLIDKAKEITPENHSIDDSQIMYTFLTQACLLIDQKDGLRSK